MKVLVVGGGISAERDVSLASAKAVFNAAVAGGHVAEFYDWDGTTQWLKQHGSTFDVVLPILHGEGGEDGTIQKILEASDVPFLGSDSTASELCFDKNRTIDLLAHNGINTPQGEVVTYQDYLKNPLFNAAHVLKPYNGGSSVDTFIYPDPAQKNVQLIEEAFKRHSSMLLEPFIAGTEITVPILQDKLLPVIEIIPPEGGTFDFENKYNGKTRELVPAQNVSAQMQDKATKLGNEIHRLFNCRHLSRIDMIIQDEVIYVLEINTMPGMTNHSLFPKAALASGIDFAALVSYLIQISAAAV
nr:D-ala D-ala ligase C-terminus [uncultured bacterium]